MADSFTYPGAELVLFQHAKNWKKYFSRQIKPLIKGNVLEVGAGIGATTLLLNDGTASKWLLLEPDEQMTAILKNKINDNSLPANSVLQAGTIDQVSETFDTIIYIDVLEHIENDTAELEKAAALLNPGGHIIVLSPAFQFLYSPFDKAIGHYRRYSKRMLRKITAPSLKIINNRYYDSLGYFAALANKLFLRQQYPTVKQVLFWDRWLIPLSRFFDNLFFHQFGKAIIITWQKADNIN